MKAKLQKGSKILPEFRSQGILASPPNRLAVANQEQLASSAEIGSKNNLTWGVAPRHGFEPRFTAPKAAVLPLDDRGKAQAGSTSQV